MRIRGHHLLCLLHFEGKGYSRDFIENMYKIKEDLEKGKVFFVVNSCDDICRKCPHMEGGVCKRDSKNILSYKDEEVVLKLGLKPQRFYDFDNIKGLILRIFTIKDFENLCGDCSWFFICKEKNLFK